MVERFISSREQWLQAAIEATAAYIDAEQAEDDYDLANAAPGSGDYDRAMDSRAGLEFTRRTLAALEAEVAELRAR